MSRALDWHHQFMRGLDAHHQSAAEQHATAARNPTPYNALDGKTWLVRGDAEPGMRLYEPFSEEELQMREEYFDSEGMYMPDVEEGELEEFKWSNLPGRCCVGSPNAPHCSDCLMWGRRRRARRRRPRPCRRRPPRRRPRRRRRRRW